MKIDLQLRTVLLTMLCICLFQPLFAQTISISPTRLFFKGNPGETVSETLTIYNSTTQPYEFLTSIQDWKRDSLGTKIYSPMGTLSNSNAKYISLPGTNFQIAPGEKKSFTVSMLIPKDQNTNSIASNSMLFFTQSNAKTPDMEGKTGVGIRVSLELGIQLFYTPEKAKKGELKFLAFEHENINVDQKPVERLAVKFENTSEINKDGFVRFELTNKQTGEEIKLKPIPIAIMPLDQQWVYYPITDLLKTGEYLAVAILDAGENNDLKVAEKDIHVKK